MRQTHMRIQFVILLFVPAILCSQQVRSLSVYGEFGYGYSETKYSLATGGISLNLGLTAGLNDWLVKYVRRTNNEGAFAEPQEKINANSILLGKSFVLFGGYDEAGTTKYQCNVTLYAGWSSIENQRRGPLLQNYPGNSAYQHIVEQGEGYPFELEFQLIIPPFNAGAISVFYNANQFRDFYGVNLILFGGYFVRNLTNRSNRGTG